MQKCKQMINLSIDETIGLITPSLSLSRSNQLVTSLAEIDKTRERMIHSNQDVKIPPEVFE